VTARAGRLEYDTLPSGHFCCIVMRRACTCARASDINPLTPTVAIWVQLWSILCQTGLSRHL